MLTEAIHIGMTPEQFWHGEPSLYDNYLSAFEKGVKDRYNEMDMAAWLQGFYMNRVLAIHNPLIKDGSAKTYFKEPITFAEKSNKVEDSSDNEEQRIKAEQAKALYDFQQFGKYAKLFNKQYFNEGEDE